MPTYLSPGVYVNEVSSGSAPIAGVGTSTAAFIGSISDDLTFPENQTLEQLWPVRTVKLCTNFGEFKRLFANFEFADSNPSDPDLINLQYFANAVYGFFNNGGTRCYVVRAAEEAHINEDFLENTLEAIDEIAIVAAPGLRGESNAIRAAIATHCEVATQDRFAVFDSAQGITPTINGNQIKEGETSISNSDYAAYYFPWIQVSDVITKEIIYVPPSGHMAGIYARVDAQRGVHKSPANEVVFGALDLEYQISRNQQDGLNPDGVNCIRKMNGNIRVWGARTVGGDANGEFKYISTRRLFNFLRESIDEGTQWVVFEPNDPALWAQITRNVSAFLKTVWSSGGLFGNTPEEAFYVKCDEETNPPEVRDQGQVVAEIGVAITQPAEYVIFNLSQWSDAQGG